MNAADTNVLVYAFDDTEPAKRDCALALLADFRREPDEHPLLWQVAGEFLNALRVFERRGQIAPTDVENHFSRIVSAFPLALPTGAIFARSFDLRSKFSLSHWDSMLLAAAKETGVTTLYSEDMTDGCDYDGVVVVNPFRGC
jgi:predicted nucleic acid-binding protein